MATHKKQAKLPELVLQAPPTGFRFDRTIDGWKLVEDMGPIIGEPTLGLDELLREGKSYVEGEVMLARAKEMGELAGQMHAERLLDQQERIPEEWRGKVLIFAGTVWRRPRGDYRIAYLDWGGERWNLSFTWLGNDWGGDFRLVRLRPGTEGDGASK